MSISELEFAKASWFYNFYGNVHEYHVDTLVKQMKKQMWFLLSKLKKNPLKLRLGIHVLVTEHLCLFSLTCIILKYHNSYILKCFEISLSLKKQNKKKAVIEFSFSRRNFISDDPFSNKHN